MNYNKPMIDLVREIRKRVPNGAKPGIKLANPEILSELTKLYHQTSDNILKALTRELFSMAGEEWSAKLDNAETDAEDGNFVTKIYRGQTTLSKKEAEPSDSKQKKPKRVYRGQVIG